MEYGGVTVDPCPVCGSMNVEMKHYTDEELPMLFLWIECNDCGFKGEASDSIDGVGMSMFRHAVYYWNDSKHYRHSLDEKKEEDNTAK